MNLDSAITRVCDFHRMIGAPVSFAPQVLPGNAAKASQLAIQLHQIATTVSEQAAPEEVVISRAAMAIEELAEWLDAHATSNLIAAADAWADRAYVLFGDAVAAGLPAEDLFSEIHRSNMTKDLDSAGTSKAVKGSRYQPPQLFDILKSSAS